jgi:hypothetical protein
MYPFDRVDDPCRWPTLAVVDDARLEPDRTWDRAVQDATWSALVREIRKANTSALATLVEPPHDALVFEQIDALSLDGISEFRGANGMQLCGTVWLAGTPFAGQSVVEIVDAKGPSTTYRHDGLAARLFAYRAPTAPDTTLDVGPQLALLAGTPIMELLLAKVHTRLLRALLGRARDFEPDIVEAHAVHGIAEKLLVPAEARGLTFDCFAPRPLQAGALAELLASSSHVPVVTLAYDAKPDVLTFVDDDSLVARVVRAHLGPRVLWPTTFAAPPPAPSKPPPAARLPPAHPLDELLALIDRRLCDIGIAGYPLVIESCDTPMVRFDQLVVRVAGENPQLLRIASAHAAASPWAAAAIDAVTAHVVTVLNVALTQITDATEAHALDVLTASLRPAQP